MIESSNISLEEAPKILHELKIHQVELEMQNEELHRTQLELQKANNRYFELYNNAPICYFTINDKGLITEANFTAFTMLGRTSSEVLMRPISDFILYEDQDIFYLYRKKFFSLDNVASCELRLVKKNRAIVWAHIDAISMLSSDKKMTICLSMSDITEQKKVEEELKEKDKMILAQSRYAAMGEMISMIAHQWRQPLNIIGISVANVQIKQAMNMLDKTIIDDSIMIITENIAFMSDTIDDFRNFFKPDLPRELTTIQNVMDTTLKIIGKDLEYNNISINIDNNSQTSLLIYKNSLVQVLLNLFGNAKDEFVTKKVISAAITVNIDENKDAISIAICDNAGGIPESIIDKINQPYFTTKKLNGTGLGLYISQTIIEKHFFGTITWHNKLHGACFVITLNKGTL